jgi:hypothetical protein
MLIEQKSGLNDSFVCGFGVLGGSSSISEKVGRL